MLILYITIRLHSPAHEKILPQESTAGLDFHSFLFNDAFNRLEFSLFLEAVNPLGMVVLGVALLDRAVAHALERIGIDADGQVDVADGSGKAETSAEAVQRDHPGADGRRDVAGTEPEREARDDETEPQECLQQDVHALTAVVKALLRHAFRLSADELSGELHKELHIVLVEAQDLADQREDAGARRDEQGDDWVIGLRMKMTPRMWCIVCSVSAPNAS